MPKDADPLSQYGWIKIVCSGDSISATAQPLNGYSVSKIDAPDSQADYKFTKDNFETEYLYSCSNGVISGGVVLHEHP